jgi:hypothetical protein
MALFLWRMAGSPSTGESCGFIDQSTIPILSRSAACWLLQTGITTNNPFRPTEIVTRAQMAGFLFRFAGSPGGSTCQLTDWNRIPSWAQPAVCWLQSAGITVSDPYRPSVAVDRGQMSAFLYRLGAELNYWLSTGY